MRSVLLLALLLVALLPRSSRAEPDDDAREAAERAERAIAEQRWCDAAHELVLVYEISDEIKALFNAGIAADRARDRQLSARSFERFAQLTTRDDLRAQANAKAAQLRRDIEARGPGRVCPVPTQLTAPIVTAPLPEESSHDEGFTEVPAEALEAPHESPSIWRSKTLAWTLIGVGGAGMLGGGGFTLSALSGAVDVAADVGGSPPVRFSSAHQEEIDRFERNRTLGGVGIVGGGIVAASGLALLLFGGDDAP